MLYLFVVTIVAFFKRSYPRAFNFRNNFFGCCPMNSVIDYFLNFRYIVCGIFFVTGLEIEDLAGAAGEGAAGAE